MNRRLIRVFAWVALATAFLGILVSARIQSEVALYVANALYIAPIVLSALLGWVCLARSQGVERRFWALLSLSGAALVVSEVWWLWGLINVDVHGLRLPAAFELFQLLAAVLYTAMVLSLTNLGSEPGVTRARLYTEAAATAVIAFTLVYMIWTRNMFDDVPGAGEAVGVIAALYPVFGFMVFGGIVSVMARRGGWSMWQVLVVIGFSIYAVGLVTWPLWYRDFMSDPMPSDDGLFTALTGLGMGLFVVAIVYRLTGPAERETVLERRLPQARGAFASAAYAGFLAVAVVLMAIGSRVARGQDASVLLVAALVLSLTVAVRGLLLTIERASTRRRATTDSVTGLRGYSAMRAEIDRVIEDSGQGEFFALVIFDIVEFKRVNATYGHAAGDRVLRQVAENVQAAASHRGEAFRAGSDALVVLLRASDTPRAVGFANIVIDVVDRNVRIGGFPIALASGAAVWPQDAITSEGLLDALGQALDVSRRSGVARGVSAVDASHDADALRLATVRNQSHVAAVRALAAAIDQRHATASGRGNAVADLTRRLAEVLAVDADTMRSLELAAQVQDVGKVGVPDRVLDKPGPLAENEFEAVQEHVLLGERIVSAAGLDDIALWVRHHHERWDGAGYPDGLAGEDIALESRILALTGSFEAMTSPRTWRDALTVQEALSEVRACSGTQFDPHLVDVFGRLVAGMQSAPAPVTLEALGVNQTGG